MWFIQTMLNRFLPISSHCMPREWRLSHCELTMFVIFTGSLHRIQPEGTLMVTACLLPVKLCMDWPAGTGPELYRYTLFCFMCGWCSINPSSTLVFQFTTQMPKPSLIPLHESHWELLPHECARLGSRVRLYFAVFCPSISWRNFYYVHTHTI